MQSRRLGKSAIHVSDICMGTMTFGSQTDEPKRPHPRPLLRRRDQFLRHCGRLSGAARYQMGRPDRGNRRPLDEDQTARRDHPGDESVGAKSRLVQIALPERHDRARPQEYHAGD